ncbi:Gfo/Idh/MocA family oxidoreductase [Enterococcus sp.]|uniref:Gfo/Idh/MocA family protein n=1 Tax=Enterococcus sp. TaxID=35783 RepID=UPI0029136AE2|nr:Gfo/Idh/MocA family oxidoreductase [Enterococcus sp.]MDU5336357.1 Gfo/Idh/MocA family oxidoreductase [Enterococcus sp.]
MKFGIIGTNFVSDFFMVGAAQVEECEVVAVCGTSLAKAKNYGEKFGIAHHFDSYQKMYESELIEAVYIAVPNSLHHAIATYFLEKGIPTFCEKPLAANADEVKDLIECARENNTYLQEGLIPLYNPNFQILRDNLNLVGKIRQVNLNFSKYSSRYDAYLAGENPTTFRNELANGATMDLGVYVVADCVGLFGKPDKVLSTASLLETGADVAGSSILSYDGFNVSLNYSKASDTVNTCEICGELGQLLIDQPSQPQKITFIERKTGKRTELGVSPKENFSYEIADMVQQVKKGEIESTKVPFETSLIIHETLTQMRKQAGIIFPMDDF